MNFNYMYLDEKVFNCDDLIFKNVLTSKEGSELFDDYYAVYFKIIYRIWDLTQK